MKDKRIWFVVAAVAVLTIIAALYYFWPQLSTKNQAKSNIPDGAEVVSSDAVYNGDFVVEKGKVLVLQNGAKLEVGGNLTVAGEIMCDNGSINIFVKGDTVIEDRLTCERSEDLPSGDTGEGISIVSAGAFTASENAVITTNGHLQIVESSDLLATALKQINSIYEEIARDSGEGNRMGPFIKKATSQIAPVKTIGASENPSKPTIFSDAFSLIHEASAAGATININGAITIKTPPKGVNQIVVFNFPNAATVNVANFWLTGPQGRNGEDDKDENCDALAQDGQNALRLLLIAPALKINDFTLELGSGGSGGDAVTKKNECMDARATGGNGGGAGNFKIIGTNSFDIEGDFIIYPGAGGNGGSAEAYGKDGEPSGNGGNAFAKGGSAEDNEKAVKLSGTVNGQNFVKFGSMTGGAGGGALAMPGRGGDAPADTNQNGGNAGSGTAEGGDGGNALIFLSGKGAGRTDDAEDNGGNGGLVSAVGANGGNGGAGTDVKKGGNGGKGSDIEAMSGKGGRGGSGNGKIGEILNEKGGNGGNGGDGCPEGKGGAGGKGKPAGEKGKDGKNICPVGNPPAGGQSAVGDQPLLQVGQVNINANPTNAVFEHKIGTSPCPQPIGTINLTTPGANANYSWKIVSAAPAWLNVMPSGTIPDEVAMFFNCRLTQYVTQTVSADVIFQLYNQHGEAVGNSVTVKVTGSIIAE